MTDSPRKWADLPANAQADAALRRAAAGIVSPDIRNRTAHYYFLEAWNRDDLARVFVAAWKKHEQAWDAVPLEKNATRFMHTWVHALTDPRAALCQLLDLLAIPVPEGLTNE